MSTDMSVTCRDCSQPFTFTSAEQAFLASRALENAPTRCPACRAQRRASRGASSGGERHMFSASCATCGNEALVPFQPSADRPVYCSDCFKQRGASTVGYSRRAK